MRKPSKPVAQKVEPNQIVTFFHCATCAPARPADQSPREWAQLEVGFTKPGIQVWCKRCELNVIHIDFQGQKVGRLA